MPFLAIYSISDTTHTGPNPWPPGADSNPASPGNTTITLNLGASYTVVEVADDDTNLDDYDGTAWFSDGDETQELASPAVINGTNYAAGQTLENEYSYTIRPTGSSDPADDITIYVIDEGGATPSIGYVSSEELVAGQTYDVVARDSDSPTAPYSTIFACFGPGSYIETPNGERRVAELRPGDLVTTLDNGSQELRWVGRRDVSLQGVDDPQVPLLFQRGSLGPDIPNRDFVVSPQHRLMVSSDKNDHITGGEECFAPARALVKRPGARAMKGRKSVIYYSLMTRQHEVLIVNGVPVESFYPSPYGLSLLAPFERLAIALKFPKLNDDVEASYGPLARRDLTALEGRKLKRKRALFEGARFAAWAS